LEDIRKYVIKNDLNIRSSVKLLDKGGIGFCICVDEKDTVVGVISDGDFRRAILNGIKLDESVDKIMNHKFMYLKNNYEKREVEEIFSNNVTKHIPVLKNGKLLEIITEESFYGLKRKRKKPEMSNPVVIMAGGKGARLDPFTRILPKPLIPMGDDPVIKVIMDNFSEFSMNDFYITLNDKGKMIKAYFQDHNLGYNLKFIEEEKPLGTTGSLKLLQGEIGGSFFVSNCDIIINCDYSHIYKYHKERKNALTMVGTMQHYTVPYGVCEIENGGDLIAIREKPEYDFLTNTGLYILEPLVLKLIPENKYFDMTDLIVKVKEKGLPVGVFPVSKKAWIDVGQWTEYRDAIEQLKNWNE